MKPEPFDPLQHLNDPEVIRAYVEETQAQLRELQGEIEEEARLNGMGGEREVALRAEVERLRRLHEQAASERDRLQAALRALVERIDQVHQDPAYTSVWFIHQIHCGEYNGPTYSKELEAARSALVVS